MIFLDDFCEARPAFRRITYGARKLRVHKDVIEMCNHLMEDKEKLLKAAPYLFMPDYRCWVEWDVGGMNVAFFFDGKTSGSMLPERDFKIMPDKAEPSTQVGWGIWTFCEHGRDAADPNGISILKYDLTKGEVLPGYMEGLDLQNRIALTELVSTIKPIMFCVLALINSPKIIRHTEVDVSRINKKREAVGRYPFHPHHEVRLNIDRLIIKTTAGHGDGASRAQHFVRTHLRFIPTLGHYVLVEPHYRGDPMIGMRDTHYRADRNNSKWPD